MQVYLLIVVLLFCFSFKAGFTKDEHQSIIEKYYKKKYTFSKDMFTNAIPLWKKVLGPYKEKSDIHYLEIGVYEGGSALWVLENILTAKSAKMTAIDPFPGKLYKIFLDNLKLSGFSDKTKVIRGYSQYELRKLPLNSYDIIYIDGSHVAKDVLSDAVLSWELVKKGGIIIFDDYRWRPDLPAIKSPKMAIDAFIDIFRTEMEVVAPRGKHRHVVIKKK